MTRHSPQAVEYPQDRHGIATDAIHYSALKVVSTLRDNGHDAYIVGGAVRDLLQGERPKDFDVATDATPEQVNRLFRSSRIVGRRFRIVHVRFGRDIIEVTTFRGSHDKPKQNRSQQSSQNDSGMLLRDNVYGSLEEDALRRDFTLNALYYCPERDIVLDYCGGLDDLRAGVIKVIGDPETRFREDPVRMLRAIRFAARPQYHLEADTTELIPELAHLMADVAAARLFDEVLKLFLSGYGAATWPLLYDSGLFAELFPQTAEVLRAKPDSSDHKLILQGLHNTDQRIAIGKPVTPAFLYGIFMWPAVRERFQHLLCDSLPEMPALHQAAQDCLYRQQSRVAIPKRFTLPMRDIWELQLRLPRRGPKQIATTTSHRYFRAGYDFLLLRESAGELPDSSLGQWWTDYQANHDIERPQTPPPTSKRRRRPRRRRNQSE